MTKKKRKKRREYSGIIALAYLNRYVFPMLIFILPALGRDGEAAFRIMSMCCLAYGLYQWIGYALRWKHIYCTWQDIYHQKMTPERIRWGWIKASEVYGVSLLFIAFGIGCMVYSMYL